MGATFSSRWVITWMTAFAEAVSENKEQLTELDAAIGDADHGENLDRGLRAVMARLPTVTDRDVATILKTVGMTLISTVGGASGPLYGTLFLQMANATTNRSSLSLSEFATALEAGVKGVMARGRAGTGDKTMLDALVPAISALKDAVDQDRPTGAALSEAAGAAERGAISTIPLIARKGRASYLGERSVGHEDPGAASSSLLLRAAARAVPVEPGP